MITTDGESCSGPFEDVEYTRKRFEISLNDLQ